MRGMHGADAAMNRDEIHRHAFNLAEAVRGAQLDQAVIVIGDPPGPVFRVVVALQRRDKA